MYRRLHVRYLYSYKVLMKLEFSLQIFENTTQTSNFMTIRPLSAQLLHTKRRGTQTDGRTDRHTDMMKLIVAFRNFTNAPKNAQFM